MNHYSLRMSLPILVCLCAITPALSAPIPIENASFESPAIDPLLNPFGAEPNIDNWIEIDIDTLGSQNTGVFINTDPNNINHFGDHDHIFNADGNQMAFLGSEAGNALEKDLAATYKPGCDYRLTVAVGTSFMFPPSTEEPIDYLELALYYRDGGEPVDIASVLIPAMDPNQWLKDFSLDLPTVNSGDQWAGKTIGITIRATGTAGGFWNLDNVRLEEFLPASLFIENASFESPVVDPNTNPFGVATDVDHWNEIDLDPFSRNTGIFRNTTEDSVDHIVNADGNQLALLASGLGNALEQDLDAVYKTGCDYRLTVGLCVPNEEDYRPTDPLKLVLYYRDVNDPNNSVDIITETIDPAGLSSTLLQDFSVDLPTVNSSDAWSGKTIGIAIRATGIQFETGGFWDLDNVRLEEFLPVSISIKNASFEFPMIDPLNAFGAGPTVDEWVEIDVDPEGLSRNTGVFANTEPNSFDHIVNADGSQLAFLYSAQGNALEQELSAQYKPGCAYRLTVAIGVSSRLPPTILEPVGTLELAFYYRDVNEFGESIDIVTRTIEATGLYPTKLRDYSLYFPAPPSDANWADKTIGIAIRATGVPGAVWVLDNVRLGESLPSEDFILTDKE